MLSPRVSIKLDLYRGGALLRSQTFVEPIIKIGNLSSSHVALDDELASRMHAMVEVGSDGDVYLLDLGSRAGTYLNGQKSEKSRLRDGDEILIGETTIRVALAPTSESLASTESGVPADPGALRRAPPATELPIMSRRARLIAAILIMGVMALLILLGLRRHG